MTKLRAFTMPKWGIEMVEGTIAEWKIAEGESFAKGDLLALVETDKITNEVEAEYAATVSRILCPAGHSYAVGTLLAVFAEGPADAAAVEAFVTQYSGKGVSESGGQPVPTPSPAPARATLVADDGNVSPAARSLAQSNGIDLRRISGSGRSGRVTHQDVVQHLRPPMQQEGGSPISIAPLEDEKGVFASPLARRIAHQHGISLHGIEGTGLRGRICKQDVLDRVALVEPAPPTSPALRPTVAAGVVVERMSPMRKAIARALTLSKSTIPHFYLRVSVQVDALMAMRTAAKKAAGEAPTVNDYMIRAVALALKAHPAMNIQVHGEEIHRFSDANIAVAVATAKGLVTPIVACAQNKSVARISAEMRQLADQARKGTLRPEQIREGSFTISNLGAFGVDEFDAIINPPQGAILAVGAARRLPVDVGHALGFATQVRLALSCDHRAIDGADGAVFMSTLRELIEAPDRLTE